MSSEAKRDSTTIHHRLHPALHLFQKPCRPRSTSYSQKYLAGHKIESLYGHGLTYSYIDIFDLKFTTSGFIS